MAIHPIGQWVGSAIRASKISQAELGRRLSKELRRDIDRAAVNKMCKGTRDIAADEMLAIEAITGQPVPSPYVATKIPLLEWVSAGKLVEPHSQIPMEDVPLLAFADLGRGDFFALKVEGDSMDRLSPDGSVIVVNRAERDPVPGKPYVFWHRTEGTTYKLWHANPDYLAPHSWNGSHDPIFIKRKKDLEVVGRVRKTMMDL